MEKRRRSREEENAYRIGVRQPRTGRGGGDDALPVPGHLERLFLHAPASPLALLQPRLGHDPLTAGHGPQELGAANLGLGHGVGVLLHRSADHVGHSFRVLGLHYPAEADIWGEGVGRGRERVREVAISLGGSVEENWETGRRHMLRGEKGAR